jgi:hypothetical protein
MKNYYAIPTSQELITTLFEILQNREDASSKDELVAYWNLTEKNFGLVATFEVFAKLCVYYSETNS